MVCSHTRGEALLAELDLPEDERRRVHTHVGVDIGARTAPEIALSILAAIVRRIRLEGLTAPPGREPSSLPLAGRRPGVRDDRHGRAGHPARSCVDGVDHWFCNPGCRDQFVADQAS